jgi:hypothetical protein
MEGRLAVGWIDAHFLVPLAGWAVLYEASYVVVRRGAVVAWCCLLPGCTWFDERLVGWLAGWLLVVAWRSRQVTAPKLTVPTHGRWKQS